MQAQATRSRRLGFNWVAVLALAIGILAVSAVLIAINIEVGSDQQANTLVAHPAPLLGEGQVDPANFLAAASERLPVIRHTALYAGEGRQEMGYLEWNTVPAGSVPEPAPSLGYMRFLDREPWAYDGDAVAGQETEDVRSTAPGIHRDEGFNDGLGY